MVGEGDVLPLCASEKRMSSSDSSKKMTSSPGGGVPYAAGTAAPCLQSPDALLRAVYLGC